MWQSMFNAGNSVGFNVGRDLFNWYGQRQQRNWDMDSANKQRDWNYQMWQNQNRENQRFWEQQRDFNLQMWHAQNEYNNPKSQMQRFMDAGLNPHLIYGQGTPGNSPSQASASLANSPKPQGYQRHSNPALLQNLGARFDGDIINDMSTNNNLESQTAVNNAIRDNKEAETFNSLMDGKKKKIESKHWEDVAQYNAEIKKFQAEQEEDKAEILEKTKQPIIEQEAQKLRKLTNEADKAFEDYQRAVSEKQKAQIEVRIKKIEERMQLRLDAMEQKGVFKDSSEFMKWISQNPHAFDGLAEWMHDIGIPSSFIYLTGYLFKIKGIRLKMKKWDAKKKGAGKYKNDGSNSTIKPIPKEKPYPKYDTKGPGFGNPWNINSTQ